MEGDIHKHLKKVALSFLKFKVTDLVANEVTFYNSNSIADAVGINFKREEVRIVECKATKADFTRDHKLFDDKTSYFNHCHYAYIMCPVGVIRPEELPYGYGLLYVNEKDEIEVVKKPIKNKGKLKTQFKTSLKNTARAITNYVVFSQENKDNKDETNNKFKRNANIVLASIRCPNCRKTTKELINKTHSTTIKCKCKTIIELDKAKIREITGFNQTFINKINKLNQMKIENADQ